MTELEFMNRALALAERSCGHTRPNPPVGAVVVKNGRLVGEGRHRRCGGDHAEAAALKSCSESPAGATVYCTLEPCSKPGRVGACCDALIAAGVGKVVWACCDPNPKNGNAAARVLRKAGVQAECWQKSRDAARRSLASEVFAATLRPFAKHVRTGLPFVHVKIAMSLDGRICDDAGASRWISGPKSLKATGKWRETADVVLVGAETARKDDPSLLSHGKRNDDLWRAVVSRSGSLPKSLRIFNDEAKDRTLVYRDAVEAIKDLGRRGFMSVLCEGGLGLARSLAEAGLVDEWTTALCPLVIGSRPLSQAARFQALPPVCHGEDVFSTNVLPAAGKN